MNSTAKILLTLLTTLLLHIPVMGQIAEPIEEPTLNIRSISVLGNTLLPEEVVNRIIAPFQERDLGLTEMKELAKSLEKEYRDRGYLLVQVALPSQKPTGGLLVLQVLEPSLGEITVEGNERYNSEFLKARFKDNIREGAYRSQDVERSLLLLNDLPDLKVKAVLRPGLEEGTTDLVLSADEDKPYHFTLDYNNFGTRLTGEHRFSLSGDFSNVLTQGDLLTVGGMIATPASATTFYQGGYSFPVGTAGTRLALNYATGAYSVGQELESLNIRGESEIATLSVSHPLTRSFGHSSDLSLALSYNDVFNTVQGLPLSADEYMVARLDYTSQWQDTQGRTVLRAGASRGLGGTRKGDPRASRAGAGSEFTKFNLDAARLQRLNESLALFLRGSAQFSGDSLFAIEQMQVGGPDTVRGFSPAETLGDQGYAMSAELQWSPLVNDPELFKTVFFVDHGGITQRTPPPGLKGSRQLTGAGLGFRVNYKQMRARLDLGFPLSPSSNQLRRSPVIYGQVTTRF